MKQPELLHYKGRNRRGTTIMGSACARVADFVSRKFSARWDYLEVTAAADGHKVGAIEFVDGKRIYWAEGDAS